MTSMPLAERMRPKSLDEFIGQEHLLGKDSILYKTIKSGSLSSFILWGPPGVGKTTIANIVANELKRPFFWLSAINSGVKDIRETIEKAEAQRFFNTPSPILFIDEIHRFSKAQQDSLLGAVEKGTVTLIGATTENPSFEVISALLSRCQVYVLKHHNEDELKQIIDRAISDDLILKKKKIKVLEYGNLINLSGGDARKLLNILEIVVNQFHETEDVEITDGLVSDIISENIALYDKAGEMHYDVISAFIKSIRGSDPNAALYYLAKMLIAGEDPLFICRRMLVLASEDVGLANPNALLMANTCFQSVHQIGMPEARIIMSQTVIYLATSPKSNSAYTAINSAYALNKTHPNASIPLALRNAPTTLMKNLDYGKNYQYAHDHEGNFVQDKFMPENIPPTTLYEPGANPVEDKTKERLKAMWKGIYKY